VALIWVAERLMMMHSLLKRALDLAIAVPALIVAAPLLAVAIVAVQWNDLGQVLFRQVRIGRFGRPFVMLKLRTMYEGSDEGEFRDFNTRELLGQVTSTKEGLFRLKNDLRILPAGRFLRKYSIDELPQLVNVIRGDMSIIGPRPSLPWEVALYDREQLRRHNVRPGMTGLWQVSGRNRLSIPQMLALDLEYVDRQSVLLDLKILFRTLPAVLRSETG
jgi:lipopolysaccharide/colanic/teichoic acid biosynthesis glycosyltransferase